MIIAGSAASDMIYGFIAMFRIATFLKDEKVEAFFWFVGGTILIILGIFTLIYSDKNRQRKFGGLRRTIKLFNGVF